MLINYLTIAWRNLRKHPGYAAVNILGLAIGMACFVLIMLFVQIELSYDRFHEKADRTYRMVKEDPGNFYLDMNHYAVTPVPLAPALKAEFPEIEQATRIDNTSGLFSYGAVKAFERGLWADEHVFDVFTWPMIQGDPGTALVGPDRIVLSASMAQKYFEDDDPVGKTIMFRNEKALQVTGIIEDPPANSHIDFDYIISFASNDDFLRNVDRWNNSSYYTYFVLKEGHAIEDLAAKIPAFTRKYLVADFQRNPDRMSRYYHQALTDIHLHSHINFDIARNGDIKYVYMFSAIATVILLIACINYMNLATARAAARFREVGIRKVVGAYRGQLVTQFLGESVILSLIAVVLAGIAVVLLLPTFNTLVERTITISAALNGRFIAGLAGVGILVGIVSGSYPALALSAHRPVQILHASSRRGTRRATLRNLLVIGQFTATIILIVSALTIQRQLVYMRTLDTGVDRDRVVVVRVRDPGVTDQFEAIRQELMTHPGVAMVTSSESLPTRVSSQTTIRKWEGNEDDKSVPIYYAAVNYDYIEMFGLQMVDGRSFSRDFVSDGRGAMILNESAIREMGWETAAGKYIDYWGSESNEVIGVVKDFNMHSLRLQIEPLMLFLAPQRLSNILVRVHPQDIPGTLAFLDETMQTFSPAYPFEYEFLDDAFDKMYQTETTLGRIFVYFTGIALIIACLGLFGLAAFIAAQRTREIGVRKVLGASLPSIIWLLSREFSLLVVTGLVLATPIAYYAMDQWLGEFAYRTELGPGLFLIAGAAALLVAWLTVSYQSLRVARTNPVESLRYE